MWPYYTADLDHKYPDLIKHPGDLPAYDKMASDTKSKTTADLWAKDTTDHMESNHMVPVFHCTKEVGNALIKDPNRSFEATFAMFYTPVHKKMLYSTCSGRVYNKRKRS